MCYCREADWCFGVFFFLFQALLIFGVWPHVVRTLAASLCGENPVGLYLELDRSVVRCSVSVAEADAVQGVVLFEVVATGDWERRVSEWLADYWSCVVDDFIPLGISCGCLSTVGGLLEGDGGRRGLQLNPLQLHAVLQIITTAGLSVFVGQDVHVVMNFLLGKLRDCLTDPVVRSCPTLLHVSVFIYLVSVR